MRQQIFTSMLMGSLVLSNIASVFRVNAQTQPGPPSTTTSGNDVRQSAGDTADKELARIRKILQAKLSQVHAEIVFPGATLGFVLPDGRAGSVSIGVSDLDSRKPLAPTDRMPAGSIGKMFVAAVALQLAQEGQLTLDDKIERWLGQMPWFSQLPNGHELTLRMLLNHTSGVPDHEATGRFRKDLVANPNRTRKPEELIAYVLKKRPLFAAGKSWSYSSTNYFLVGMIVEQVTGKSLFSEISRRLLIPLKLTNTIPSDRRILPDLIQGYSKEISPLVNETGPYTKMIGQDGLIINPQWEWAGGGLASTPEDLARWAKALFEGKVLEKTYLDQMLAGVKSEGNLKYGLGVVINRGQSGELYGHDGFFPGYISNVEYSPQHRIAVAIQFNTDFFSKVKKGGPPVSFSLYEIIPIIADALDKKTAGALR